MKVQIRSVEDRGDLSKERIVLRVNRDVDLGSFMLVRTAFEAGRVTTGVMNAFWFPDLLVSAKDIVVVYSKSGNPNSKELSEFRRAYFFYWEQGSTLWNDEDVAPVLLYAPEWMSKAPQDFVASSS